MYGTHSDEGSRINVRVYIVQALRHALFQGGASPSGFQDCTKYHLRLFSFLLFFFPFLCFSSLCFSFLPSFLFFHLSFFLLFLFNSLFTMEMFNCQLKINSKFNVPYNSSKIKHVLDRWYIKFWPLERPYWIQSSLLKSWQVNIHLYFNLCEVS